MIVAGVGFSPGVAAEKIVELVAEVVRKSGVVADTLAVPDFKNCPEIQAAAAALGLPLLLLERDALQAVQSRCVTRSAVAEAATGLASIAEACALAGAGSHSRLLVARVAQGRVTCAVAEEQI